MNISEFDFHESTVTKLDAYGTQFSICLEGVLYERNPVTVEICSLNVQDVKIDRAYFSGSLNMYLPDAEILYLELHRDSIKFCAEWNDFSSKKYRVFSYEILVKPNSVNLRVVEPELN